MIDINSSIMLYKDFFLETFKTTAGYLLVLVITLFFIYIAIDYFFSSF